LIINYKSAKCTTRIKKSSYIVAVVPQLMDHLYMELNLL
jgi:hypothetical protein